MVCTDGGKGTEHSGITAAELAATRAAEQAAAAQLLGVKEIVTWATPTVNWRTPARSASSWCGKFAASRPDVVMVTEPYVRSMVWHRDHRSPARWP